MTYEKLKDLYQNNLYRVNLGICSGLGLVASSGLNAPIAGFIAGMGFGLLSATYQIRFFPIADNSCEDNEELSDLVE
jgi:hypothetical protein